MLNKRKGLGGPLQQVSPAVATDTVDGIDTRLAGPSNVVNTDDTLSGLEDLTHGTNDRGMPFILVDGAACTTRSDLRLALSRIEQKRMEKVLTDIDISNPPKLEDTGPPPELDMNINLGPKALAERKAAEEEKRFQKDMGELTFWPPEDNDASTKIPTFTNNSTINRIDQVIHKLDKLRDLAEKFQTPKLEIPSLPTKLLSERPSLHRQGTFDIKRKDERDKDSGPDMTNVGAATSKKPQSQKSPYKGGVPSLIQNMFPEKKFHTARAWQLMNQIAAGFTELSVLYEEEKNRVPNEESVYCYMVTISSVSGSPNCTIEPVTETEFQHLCLSQNPSSFKISEPKRSKSELNSSVTVRKSSATAPFKQPSSPTHIEQRGRSQALPKTSRSFINIPSPAKHYQGRKRD